MPEQYKMVAENPQSTVVSDFEPVYRKSTQYQRCRIVKERFRCHKFGFEDMVILIACGLHNFRITHKMSHDTVQNFV